VTPVCQEKKIKKKMTITEKVQQLQGEYVGKKMKVKVVKVGEPTKLGHRSILFALKDGRMESKKSFFISSQEGLLGTTILKKGVEAPEVGDQVSVSVKEVTSYVWEGVEKIIAYVLLD
jgi:hypothetical protein